MVGQWVRAEDRLCRSRAEAIHQVRAVPLLAVDRVRRVVLDHGRELVGGDPDDERGPAALTAANEIERCRGEDDAVYGGTEGVAAAVERLREGGHDLASAAPA